MQDVIKAKSRGDRDTCDITPDAEGGIPAGAIPEGRKEMAAKLEVIMNAAVVGQKHCACRVDLKRCIFRSRRRVGWCDTPARLWR
jgi:hypothetical protein